MINADLSELFQLPLGIDKLALVGGEIGELAIDTLADALGGRVRAPPGCVVWMT